MTRNMKNFIKGNRILLIKIPSHEDKFGRPTIISNDIADRLALEGRLLSRRLMLRTVPHNQMTHSFCFYRTLQDTTVDPLRCALAPAAPVLRSTSEGRAARDQSPEDPFRSAPAPSALVLRSTHKARASRGQPCNESHRSVSEPPRNDFETTQSTNSLIGASTNSNVCITDRYNLRYSGRHILWSTFLRGGGLR